MAHIAKFCLFFRHKDFQNSALSTPPTRSVLPPQCTRRPAPLFLDLSEGVFDTKQNCSADKTQQLRTCRWVRHLCLCWEIVCQYATALSTSRERNGRWSHKRKTTTFLFEKVQKHGFLALTNKLKTLKNDRVVLVTNTAVTNKRFLKIRMSESQSDSSSSI